MNERRTRASAGLPDLPVVDDVERACLTSYVRLLADTLGAKLVEVVLFGSVARGESWPRGMPIRSDLDLLVVTREPLGRSVVSALLDATLPLFLESGRQIGPQFRSRAELDDPKGERAARFVENVRRDGIRVYP